jgi:carbon storage regulator
MLVLTRKVGQKIYVGDSVVITVTALEGNKVRLGITAPASMEVWRSELLARSPERPAEPASQFVVARRESEAGAAPPALVALGEKH